MGRGEARARWSADPVIDWVLREGRRMRDPQAVLGAICDRVRAAGMPLDRVYAFITTLHPQYFGYVLTWQDGRTGIIHGEHDQVDTDEFRLSPAARIVHGERVIRRVLHRADCPMDHPVLAEMRTDGFSDYVIVEMVFSTGARNAVSLATRAARGFDDADIREVERLLHLFALLMESHANRGIAANLLDAYLGKLSGQRVLDGQIRRGDGDRIDAVIWFSDLRDSTRLAERLGEADFLALLNEYFEATAGAVLAHGGEVLRFIGDASLAVFPVPGEEALGKVCARSLAAARDARSRAAASNAARENVSQPPFAFGVGLHRGEVLYGNIGTPDRIEFSVVGPAANETARIEALCKDAGTDVVVSESVVRHAPAPAGGWPSLGTHRLRGVARDIEVFGLPP